MYYRNADVAILVYDITQQATLSVADEKSWQITEIQKTAPNCSIILVGNKADCSDNRAVPTSEAREIADKRRWPFFEASAKEDMNINEIFDEVLKIVSKKSHFNSKNPF